MNGWPVSRADTRQEMTAYVGTATTRGTFRGLSPSVYTRPIGYITRQEENEMIRIKGLALGLGVATLIVVGLACGAGEPAPAGMGSMVPDLRLTFEGVDYSGVEILGAASPNGGIVCCGTPINMDDMELVGTGAWHQPDVDRSVDVFRPKAGATTDVYTFHPSQTLSKVEGAPPEDETDTTPATWTRWTAG
jgi:hypothetical protein